MYIQNRWEIKNEIEVENVFSGRYGKSTSPSERKMPTPEEQKKINERQSARKLRRKIHANFDPNDLFETLTYGRDRRPDPKGAAHELELLLDRLRGVWKRAGTKLRYIVVTEYKSKSIHHHLIVNDLPDGSGAKKIAQSWRRNGNANTKYLYEDGQYERLAEYLIKETSKTFRDPDNPSKLRYSCSRNLVTPVAKTRILKRDDWPEEPRVPKGYYLEKDSLVNGVNKMGYRYQYYRLIKIGGQKPQHGRKTGRNKHQGRIRNSGGELYQGERTVTKRDQIAHEELLRQMDHEVGICKKCPWEKDAIYGACEERGCITHMNIEVLNKQIRAMERGHVSD